MHINRNEATDADLLLNLREGSRDAFDILYNRYWKKVFNAAYKRVDDKEIAEDIAQDIFVQLWVRGTTSLIVDLPGYLFIAARNGVFTRMGKEEKYVELPANVFEVGDDDFAGADSKVLHQEFINSFNKLVENLPEQQRIIFKLRFHDSLSSQEIAEKLQISPKTVRNHIGRALATLKNEMIVFQILLFLVKNW